MDIIVGTAGHIDHGKTALVKALTGIDADRLPEEKQRGITIDIGFAELELGEFHFGFVDVPGHERFVKNMLAGASGVDLVLLVIAADEGVMPQTREHFEICRLLGMRSGVVALNKKDLVDDETVELVKAEAAELVAGSFLQDAPVVAVSSRSGEGIDELRKTMLEAATRLRRSNAETVARVPIDRSFTVKGFGTVVTGTLISGTITEADELDLLPERRLVRVRGLQTHSKPVRSVHAGQRVALNLGGIDHAEISRGMVLAARNSLEPAQVLDAEIEMLTDVKRELRSRQRVRIHIGTAEALARVQVLNDTGRIEPGKRDLAQLRLEIPVTAIPNDRFIIRSYSPQRTIGGGRVVDAMAAKHRQKDVNTVRLKLHGMLRAGDDRPQLLGHFLDSAGGRGLSFAAIQARTGWRKEILEEAIRNGIRTGSIVQADPFLLTSEHFFVLKETTVSEVEKAHRDDPLSPGMMRETLRERVFGSIPTEIFQAVVSSLEADKILLSRKDTVGIAGRGTTLSADEAMLLESLRKIYIEARLEVPKLDEALANSMERTKFQRPHARKIFQLLLDNGELVKVTDEFYFSKPAVSSLIDRIRAEASGDRLIDVPAFKELAGVSRKYAIPLLEYFDREKVTLRKGDKRLIL